MGSDNRVIRDALVTIGSQRVALLVAGAVIVMLGVTALLSPLFLETLLVRALGLVVLAAAVTTAGQWVFGRRGDGRHRRGLLVSIGYFLLLLLTAGLLLGHSLLPRRLLAIAIGLVFLADAGAQGIFVLQAKQWRTRITLAISLLVTAGAGLFAIFRSGTTLGEDLIAWVLGVKLLAFGVMLLVVAWQTPKEEAYVFGLRSDRDVEPIPGELYAVFIGNAFHLGVCVGEGEVVDYRDDNLVHLVTWEQFLLGREPQHWEYPDLPDVPAEAVIARARVAVGGTYPYKFFEFNCESFAIWCKSDGATHRSQFAQLTLAFANVESRPLLGTTVELYTRVVEYIAFHIGGTLGKRAAFAVRRVSAAVGKWLLASRLQAVAAPVELTAGETAHSSGGQTE